MRGLRPAPPFARGRLRQYTRRFCQLTVARRLRDTGQKLGHVVQCGPILAFFQEFRNKGDIIAIGGNVRLHCFIGHHARPKLPMLAGRRRENRFLKHCQAGDRFVQKSVRARVHRPLFHRVIAAHAQENAQAWRRLCQIANEIFARPIGKPKINDCDRRSVNFQVPLGRCEAVGPPDPCPATKAHQSKRLTGIPAVFDHQNGHAKKRPLCSWSPWVKNIKIIHSGSPFLSRKITVALHGESCVNRFLDLCDREVLAWPTRARHNRDDVGL